MLLRILLAILLLPVAALAQVKAIRAGSLIDPATGKVAKNQVILVKEGKIAEVGGSVEIPRDAEVVDLSNAWVMPGLMDAHVHLTFSVPGGASLVSVYLSESSGLRALRGAYNARVVLEAGFTVVKDIGNDANYAAVDVRRGIQRGWAVGPTFLNTGKIIAAFGGQSQGVPSEQGLFWQHEYIDADTPDEIRKAVRQNIYYGANAIKLVADNNRYFYSLEEIKAAVDESHRAGVTCAVHVLGGEAARNVILGGADAIEHGWDLSDDLLKLMKEKGTFLVGTDFPEEHLKLMGFNPVAGPLGKTLAERIIDRLRRAHQMGVKMAFGTDVVLEMPKHSRADLMLDYLAVWRTAGIPNADILKAMTTNAAELFQMQKERGAIAAGLYADIIATPASPLDDIEALRKVHFVMKAGKVYKHTK